MLRRGLCVLSRPLAHSYGHTVATGSRSMPFAQSRSNAMMIASRQMSCSSNSMMKRTVENAPKKNGVNQLKEIADLLQVLRICEQQQQQVEKKTIVDGIIPLFEMPKREYKPSVVRRKRKHGFLARKRDVGGRNVLKRRMKKGRHRLSA